MSEGADARRRSEEATSSYNSIKAEHEVAQSQAKQAVEAAAAEISSLQASHQPSFFALLVSMPQSHLTLQNAGPQPNDLCLLVSCHAQHSVCDTCFYIVAVCVCCNACCVHLELQALLLMGL